MTLNSDSSGAGVTKQGGARLRLDPTAYRSITREQWLLRETRIVAALLVDEDATREEIVQRAQAENIFQYPTERMRSNIARVCLARIDALEGFVGSGDEAAGAVEGPDGGAGCAVPARELVGVLAHGTDEQARQANLYVLARSYRLVRECLLELVAPRLAVGDTRLTRADFAAFLAEVSQRSDAVAAWSPVTLEKCRQVLARCLAEAGVIVPVAGTRASSFELRPLLVDPQVAAIVAAAGDGELASSLFTTGE